MGCRSVRVLALMLVLGVAFAGARPVFAGTSPPSKAALPLFQDDGQDAGLPVELQGPPTTQNEPPPIVAPDYSEQDSMLPPVMDPDDDDDGVQDADDSHPNDPTRGEKPPPGPTDPIADDDVDGLPNVMDPDDSNNGIPDAEEGVGTMDPVAPETPDTPTTPREPATGQPTTPRDSSDSSGRSNGVAPLVNALPSTGTGSGKPNPLLPILLIGSIILLATSSWSRRKSRP